MVICPVSFLVMLLQVIAISLNDWQTGGSGKSGEPSCRFPACTPGPLFAMTADGTVTLMVRMAIRLFPALNKVIVP